MAVMPSLAIVLGGAECWQHDLSAALQLLSEVPEFFVVNDQIASFPGNITACTLHPENLDGWLEARSMMGLSAPRACWTRKHNEIVDHSANQLQEWGGTSGLFAFQVARQHGHQRIIFCGVPMNDSRNAFHAMTGIAKYSRHSRIWSREHLHEIKPFARSMSGWTAELLGTPDEEWFNQREK